MSDGTVEQKPLDDYLAGVILAEMPASFGEEALKAQAVVSRTYTLRQTASKQNMTAPRHLVRRLLPGMDFRYEDYCAKAGEAEDRTEPRRRPQAVKATDGQVLVMTRRPHRRHLLLLFGRPHGDGGGGLGQRCALQSVDSPGESAPCEDTISFSTEEFPPHPLPKPGGGPVGSPESWFGAVSATEGAGWRPWKTEEPFTGKELRSLLGLRSTVFAVSVMGDEIFFQTRGYGHRVGMSQYGAQAMAQAEAAMRSFCTITLASLKITSNDLKTKVCCQWNRLYPNRFHW